MEIVYLDNNFKAVNLAITIGSYDGIHQGHLKIFNLLIECKKNSYKTGIITFINHPDYTLSKRNNVGYINTLDEKIDLFSKLDIDYLFLLSDEYINLSYTQFNEYLMKIGVKKVIVGEDFRYGKEALGNISSLKEDFEVVEVELVKYSNFKASSQKIRDYLKEGNLELMRQEGYQNYCIQGKVMHGNGIGHKYGFPTANIDYKEIYLLIKKGVYAAKAYINSNSFYAVCNIGINPTVSSSDIKLKVEVYIIDFDCDIYGESIKLELVSFIREEKKFSSIDELGKQVNIDRIVAREKLDKFEE